jgi:rubrerythrin
MTTAYTGSELVAIAIQIEGCGEAFYEAAVERFEDPKIRELFTFLRDEEKRHAALFESLLAQLTDVAAEWRQSEEYVTYMRALAENRVFPDPDAARAAVAGISDEADALRIAIGFEKDTILFLYEMRPMVREKDRAIVDELIAEEQRHVRTLSGLAAALRKG